MLPTRRFRRPPVGPSCLRALVIAMLGACSISAFPAGAAAATRPATATSIARLTTLTPHTVSASPSAVVDLGGVGYFIAGIAGGGDPETLQNYAAIALMRTDGTAAGTTVVKTFASTDPETFTPPQLSASGGALWFKARATTADRFALWRSDGTTAGTVRAWTAAWGPEPFDPTILAATPTALAIGDAAFGSRTLVRIDTVGGSAHAITSVPERGIGRVAFDSAGTVYFTSDALFTATLWRDVDGVATNLTAEAGSGPTLRLDTFLDLSLTAVGTHVYFVRADDAHGNEPWVSDGTVAGTHLAVDATPGPAGSTSIHVVSTPAATFITTDAAAFRDTGTGPMALPALAGTQPTAMGGALYVLKDGWLDRLDDGADALVGLTPVAPTPAGSPFVVLGGALYFASGADLWRTAGTAETTTRLGTVPPLPSSGGHGGEFGGDRFGVAGGIVYFRGADPVTGEELWRVGEGGAPRLVADLGRGSVGGPSRPAPSLGDTGFLFAGDTELGNPDDATGSRWTNPHLVATDGTSAGTRTVATFADGQAPTEVVRLGSRLFFVLTPPSAGQGSELWTADAHGARRIALPSRLPPGTVEHLVVAGDRLFFAVTGAGDLRQRLAFLRRGTVHVVETLPGDEIGTAPTWAAMGPEVVFPRKDGVDTVLWRSDGTRRGTRPIPRTEARSVDTDLHGLGRHVVFGSARGAATSRVWVTDGTRRGTHPLGRRTIGGIATFVAGPKGAAYVATRTEAGAGLAGSGAATTLWRTDGRAGGTRLVYRAATDDEALGDVVRVGRSIAFTTSRELGQGAGLWRTDGTRGGTERLAAPTTPGPFGSLAAVGGRLYLDGPGPSASSVLWTSDGTAKGTHPDASPEAAGVTLDGPSSRAGRRAAVVATTADGHGLLLGLTPGSGANHW
ncbi:MAG: hypothetical protein AAGC46_17560 [Solirubrobacteraceae bacterium]|nr:hypothetical protein [Patulibacter sp.]